MTEGIKNVSVQTLRVRRNVTSVHEHLLKVQTPAREINTVAGYIQFLDSLLTKQTARVLALLEAAWVGVKENYLQQLPGDGFSRCSGRLRPSPGRRGWTVAASAHGKTLRLTGLHFLMEVNELLIPLEALQLGGTGVFFPLCFGAGNHL